LGLKDLHTSVNDALNVVEFPALPLKSNIKVHIQDHLSRYSNHWADAFKQLIKAIPGLSTTSWFNDEWLLTHIQSFFDRFDKSFERWRVLYRNARQMVDTARLIIDDPTPQSDSRKRLEAERQEKIGKRQIDLLLNKENRSYGGESEFYIFRYMASEGFLPGYNFTRLPVRAFLGYRHLDKGEFVSRPRFIAIREFGPNNLIYHNGSKFRISRMQLPHGDALLQTIKVSRTTGYAFLNDEALGINNDPINNVELKGGDFVESFNNLMELAESDAKPQERISCEEEERMSTGSKLINIFHFLRELIKPNR
ncbi:hypothetical protein HXX01_02330, partial [Candidatus Nomurabacteria bacterium]|nr:hypothetical protein [Candidatus Nomurabacteria bacterium]